MCVALMIEKKKDSEKQILAFHNTIKLELENLNNVDEIKEILKKLRNWKLRGVGI